jgi:hypothetical protein
MMENITDSKGNSTAKKKKNEEYFSQSINEPTDFKSQILHET